MNDNINIFVSRVFCLNQGHKELRNCEFGLQVEKTFQSAQKQCLLHVILN